MALFIKTLLFLIRLIPVRVAGALGAGLGRFVYLVDARHRNIALRNLNRIYPDKEMAWKIRIAHESFAELGRTTFEIPHVYMRSKAFLSSRIQVEGEEAYRDALKDGNGVIMMAMHHSNWELGALSISMMGYESEMIYRSVRQPNLDKVILQARSRFGAQLHSRNDGLRWFPRALKNGNTICILVDQHLSNGTPIPFLGHMANTTTLPASFAAKYNTPLFGAHFERIGRSFRFKLHLWPIELPSLSNDKHEAEIETMQVVCDSFAPVIHQRPELWLWIHRRWLYLDERESEQAS